MPVYRRTLLRPLLRPATLLVVLLPLLVGFGPPRQANVNIQISLEAAYGGRFRPNYWTPLLLTLSNDGPDVRGALRVRADNTSGLNATDYSTPLDLPRQSHKQVFLYVSLQRFAQDIVVELADETGMVIAQAESQVLPAIDADVLSAVVTDSPSGSVDLSGIEVGTGESYQVNWSVENLPPQADALLGLDVIVFSDVDTGRLSVQQQDALADWVLAGGHLIVSGGPNYRLTTTALVDLLPVTISGTVTADDLTALATFAGQYADSLAEPNVILAVGEPRSGARVLATVEGHPALVRRQFGDGLVDYLAADPNLAPFRRWNGASALWETLVMTPPQTPNWSAGFQDWEQANQVIRQAPGYDLPTALQMSLLLAVYIGVIGPVNYLVLRIIGRRELAWLTIPALVLVFSVIAYFAGFSLRGTQATMNRLSVVQVWPEAERAQVDGLLGLLSPRRSVYQIGAPAGLTLRPLPTERTGSGGITSAESARNIQETGTYAAVDLLVDSSLVTGFSTSGFIDLPARLDGEATLTIAAGQAPQVSGYVANTTGFRLEEAVLLVQGGSMRLGTLEPGDRADFDLPLTGRRSRPLALVQSLDLSAGYQTDDNLTVQDIIGPAFATIGLVPSADERLIRQRQDFLTAIIEHHDFGGGRGDRVFLVGWAAESPLDFTLEGASWVAEDMTLYIFEVPLLVAETDEAVIIPPSLSTWITLDETTASGASPYDLVLNGTEQVAFRYTPLPSAQLSTVTRLDLTAQRFGINEAMLLIWDWQDEAWVMVELNNGVRATIEAPARFVGPANAVQVLVVPNNINAAVQYAQLDVTWHGTF